MQINFEPIEEVAFSSLIADDLVWLEVPSQPTDSLQPSTSPSQIQGLTKCSRTKKHSGARASRTKCAHCGESQLEDWCSALKSLHLSCPQLDSSVNILDPVATFETLSARLDPVIVEGVSEIMEASCYNKGTAIMSLDYNIVHPFPGRDESDPWLMMQWTESNGDDVLTLIELDDEGEHSYVMHTFRRGDSDGTVTFNVTDVEILKRLLQGGQHVLGLRQMPKEDAVTLYCGPRNADEYSSEKLKMLAGLLVAHFRGIEEVGIAFDSIVPELEQFCSKEVTTMEDGSCCVRYYGSLSDLLD